MGNFELTVEITEGIHRLSFPDDAVDFDELAAPVVRSQLREHLEEATSSEIILNIGGVEYIDSTALGVMVGGFKRAQALDKSFAIDITNAPDNCRRIFKITGLDRVITLIDERTPADD